MIRLHHPVISVATLTSLLCVGFLACVRADTLPVDTPENKIAPGSEASIKPATPEPLVKKISPVSYRIGKITFNKDTREITLPAQTNITNPDTILEYLLVHINGEKIHEALIATEADPSHLNIALKLLNYKESRELFRLPRPDGTPSEEYPVVTDEIKKSARFGVYITWKDGETHKTIPATQWIEHRVLKKPMSNLPWVYNGSFIYEQKFNAKLTGNILTIFPDEGSIANYPGKDRWDDTLWVPAAGIPEEGTPITVSLKPWKTAP